MPDQNRREFLKFIGSSCLVSLIPRNATAFSSNTPFKTNENIFPTFNDNLTLAEGFTYQPLISWKDPISTTDYFGFNCDYTAFTEIDSNSGILWVNHEYVHPLFIHGNINGKKSKQEVEKEMYNMGGSLVHINRNSSNANWKIVQNSTYNRRITSLTKIPFANNQEIEGSKFTIGMVANCAGGKTPWNTILTCEENFDSFHGLRKKEGKKIPGDHQWENYYDFPPEHYGWVVEVNPFTGEAKKHTSLGRFCHECATTTTDNFGNVVVYSGDDTENEFLYKFISDKKDSLDTGILYVADLENKKWLPLDLTLSPKLKNKFNRQIDVMINCRKAAKMLGATPLDRPEDIEVHPLTKEVFVCLSNNKKKNNYHGSILKIIESKSNPLEFSFETFLAGGENFSCPDNLTFDKNGNIWLCCDISGKSIGDETYKKFGNNGLYFIPTQGKDAGSVIQIAAAPVDAELTGVTLSPDEKTLFLSVQHPGELSTSLENLTSNWPTNKKNAIPKPTVIQLKGPLL